MGAYAMKRVSNGAHLPNPWHLSLQNAQTIDPMWCASSSDFRIRPSRGHQETIGGNIPPDFIRLCVDASSVYVSSGAVWMGLWEATMRPVRLAAHRVIGSLRLTASVRYSSQVFPDALADGEVRPGFDKLDSVDQQVWWSPLSNA